MDFLGLEAYFKQFSTHMDYVGQKRAERIFQVIIVVHGVIGFVIGYLAKQLSLSVYTLGIGFLLSALIILPPWPYFRRNDLQWQKVGSGDKKEKKTDAQKKKKK